MIQELATEWEWFRTSVMLCSGEWLNDILGARVDLYEHEKSFWHETHPYMNITKNMAVQFCDATIQVWEREWRWNGISKIDKDIQVSFSKELGSEAGSWKGGTVGCSYLMNPGEKPVETLRRMEKERRFL